MTEAMATDLSTFGAAVLGALVGGIISYVLQAQSLRAASARHAQDRDEVRKAAGYSILLKMIRKNSDFEMLRRPLRAALDNSKRLPASEPWQIVLPVANPPRSVNFTAEEMTLVLSLSDVVFNKIAALDEMHGGTAELFAQYAQKRAALTAGFGAEKMEGSTGTTSLTQDQYFWLIPRAYELNAIVSHMVERTNEGCQESREGLVALHQSLTEKLGLKHKLEFIDAPQAI